MASVSLANVVKYYGKIKTIDNVNLEIASREFIVLVGPSGCGKSTLLRMIAGLEDVNSGEIKIEDKMSPKLMQGHAGYRWYFNPMRFIPI